MTRTGRKQEWSVVWRIQPIPRTRKNETREKYEQNALSGYEYLYKLPKPVDRAGVHIRIYIEAKSGVDPDADIKIRVLGTGATLDNFDPDKILSGKIFKNDASNTEICTATPQIYTIDIA